jgi:endonuclease-3
MDRELARKGIPLIISRLRKELKLDDGPSWNRMDPFQCLIGTVLSARTRDESTAKAASALFAKYPDAMSLSRAPVKEIEQLIKPSGFYKVKARRVKQLASYLLEHHNGQVPRNMDELVRLPGVGRKTAGCVLVYSFRIPAIPTDTHVHKIANRIGLVKAKTPEQTEQELMKIIPRDKWIIINHLFVRFGQQLCKPIKPECWRCPIEKVCEYPDKNLKAPDI